MKLTVALGMQLEKNSYPALIPQGNQEPSAGLVHQRAPVIDVQPISASKVMALPKVSSFSFSYLTYNINAGLVPFPAPNGTQLNLLV
ncbi:MAG: hypothetical protein R8M38_10195 [Mariprofundaceae bacterium]